tara:strand:- start:1177 stop:1950 length:774 start_codon:yes stop_codon:yes gene_type:complete
MYSRLVTSAPKCHQTYKRISQRLHNCNIELDDYVGSDLHVYESALDGITFKLKSPMLYVMDFEKTLTLARKYRNLAFRSKKLNDEHWPFMMSLAATNGLGFREIQYPFLSDMDLSAKAMNNGKTLNIAKLGRSFGAQFGDTIISMNSHSLHCAIDYSGEHCSIHIDETGFVIGGLNGDVVLNPELIRHTLVELLWKDKLKVPKGIELVTPSASNYYDRIGLRTDLSILNKKTISAEQSCSVHSGLGCAVTMSLSGMF